MYRVVLVDDERLIIRGLSTVVPWTELGCEVAGTAHDGAAGLALIRDLRPDIVLTDIRMPNMDGLTMLAAIRSEFPEIQMSVLTAYRDFEYARQAITLGVCRYLLKPSDLEELKDAFRQMVSRLDAMPGLREEVPEDESVREAGEPPGQGRAGVYEGTLYGTAPVPGRRGGSRLREPVASFQIA